MNNEGMVYVPELAQYYATDKDPIELNIISSYTYGIYLGDYHKIVYAPKDLNEAIFMRMNDQISARDFENYVKHFSE